jgi:hypothetical protein
MNEHEAANPASEPPSQFAARIEHKTSESLGLMKAGCEDDQVATEPTAATANAPFNAIEQNELNMFTEMLGTPVNKTQRLFNDSSQ